MVEIAQRQRWVKLRGHLTKSQSHLFSRDLEERFEAKIKMVVLVFLFFCLLPLMFWVCMYSEILPKLFCVSFNADLYIFLDLWV